MNVFIVRFVRLLASMELCLDSRSRSVDMCRCFVLYFSFDVEVSLVARAMASMS